MGYQLSVIIPARNEVWLRNTVEDVLQNSGPQTELIVLMDGAWANPGLVQNDRVQIVHLPASIGQRASTNLGIQLSMAPYVMKLDAHCSVAEGFDSVLLRDAKLLGPNVAQVPTQFNLHVFDWKCNACGHTWYMGPDPDECPSCKQKDSTQFHKVLIWKPRRNRRSNAWRFDKELHFQYWGQLADRYKKDSIHDTMSCLGACWFVNREHFLSLGALDERHGSWGQMGTEMACKYWLSGGRLVTNKNTWFSHLFRTRPGFGFPYPLSGDQQVRAREHSKWLWLGNNWPQAIYPLRWMITKFAPVPGWSE
jgi:glycosyltransferase involved in cell wall biosynthesis